MQLNETGLQNKAAWQSKGYRLPEFDRQRITKLTKASPAWIHFGAGSIFRAFPANVVQQLLNAQLMDRGLIVTEGYDYEIIEKINHRHDDYSILVTLKADGSMEKTVVGSVVESLPLDSANEAASARLKDIFTNSSLQMATFTITEKGYSLVDGNGNTLPDVSADMGNGPEKPQSYIGKVTALLYQRFLHGQKPLAMVSMDNCSHNGVRLYHAIAAFAQAWEENKLTKPGFLSYLMSPGKVSFPWSMIDKITPRPDAAIADILKKDGVTELDPVITAKNTYAAPYVNAEECEYLVIEDAFPNGRPVLEKGGIIFTDQETVHQVEQMKVCTCLNPLHTALAVFGCLLGYDLIFKTMQDETLKKLAAMIGYQEGLPVVVNPGIMDPGDFIDTVLNIRFPNPFIPDTPQRIITDTSQKLAVRFGETIKAYHNSNSLRTTDLKFIPLVFAGWLRYLMAIDDQGNDLTLSPDPLLDSICPYVAAVKLGDRIDAEQLLLPLLENPKIFGVNLSEMQLALPVCRYFTEMIAAPGAVRATLERYL